MLAGRSFPHPAVVNGNVNSMAGMPNNSMGGMPVNSMGGMPVNSMSGMPASSMSGMAGGSDPQMEQMASHILKPLDMDGKMAAAANMAAQHDLKALLDKV